MPALQATLLFEVRDLWVARDGLGFEFSVTRDGFPVTVALPRKPDDFLTWKPLPGRPYEAIGRPTAGTVDSELEYLSVKVLRAVVDIASGPRADEFADSPSAEEFIEEVDFGAASRAFEALNPARDAAVAVVEDFVLWTRAGWSQAWLGLSSERLTMAGPSSVVEVATSRRLPIGLTFGGGAFASLRSTENALTRDALREISESLERGDEAPLPETFLADAQYLAWEHRPPDPVRAVLMAAIAAEIKVKAFLREHASDEQRPLVDFILKNHREVTVTAVDGLFDKLMKTALGRSLREEDMPLFKRVRALFELRNDIAHAGARASRGDAEAVRAATDAFAWLGS